MATLTMVAADIIAIAILAAGMYFRRHRRRDLVVAFIGVNIGVLAVSLVLAASTASVGFGLGLFGVLSIIRLRSSEISQREVAYYFASLALGLIAGLSSTVSPLALGLMALIVAVLFIVDHPKAFGRSRHALLTLDRAIADEHELHAHLQLALRADVKQAVVQHIDFVNDTTLVDVRFRTRASGPSVALDTQALHLTGRDL